MPPMSPTLAIPSLQTSHEARVEGACDLCHSTEAFLLAEPSLLNSQIVLCGHCHLMYACPQLSPDTLDSFYDDDFRNDPGSRMRPGEGLEDQDDIRKQDATAEWGLDIIKRFTGIKDKKILNLRCQSGALAARLKSEGAIVYCVEPFEKNIQYATKLRGLAEVSLLPFSGFPTLPIPYPFQFDVINILMHHVLAHILSPRTLLEKLFEMLVPGGYLFLDEKDVLLPARYKTQSIFESGLAHQYHLTVHTTARYLESTGFRLIECQIDKKRISDFHHIRAIAQKPDVHEISTGGFKSSLPYASIREIQQRLEWLRKTWAIRQAGFFAKRKTSKLMRRLRKHIR
ncbi:MAG: methyltransferase domain-containing protein [Nitrospirae bacterium]|nr:methyltransferase domain-containing protein [Nitrospirota bacterium]